MALFKKVKKKKYEKGEQVELITVPNMSYVPSDKMAALIIELWANEDYADEGGTKFGKLGDSMLDRDNDGTVSKKALDTAKAYFNDKTKLNMCLERPVVITEQEHDEGWISEDEKEVVFVLPNKPRVVKPAKYDPKNAALLDTAKLLMACTPHGI